MNLIVKLGKYYQKKLFIRHEYHMILSNLYRLIKKYISVRLFKKL